jgi:hypothetical protein
MFQQLSIELLSDQTITKTRRPFLDRRGASVSSAMALLISDQPEFTIARFRY